jgi:hypothetical protein
MTFMPAAVPEPWMHHHIFAPSDHPIVSSTGGATEEQLKRMRWNLPQLQLWQDGAVKSLSGIHLEDKGRARTTIRRLVSDDWPRVTQRVHKSAHIGPVVETDLRVTCG